MSLNGYAALQRLDEYIEDKKHHNEPFTAHEREVLDVVRRDAIHAIHAKVDHSLYTEYDRLKLIELEYMYQVRGVRQVMPSAIFREGYAGYGNSWTGSTIRLLYPQDRKRGGRMSREPVIPIDKLKDTTFLKEQLVPLRINLATDKYRLKDRILWNAEDATIPLELFVEITLEDYGLPLSLVPTVYRSLQEQITNHLPHIFPVPPEERAKEIPVEEPAEKPTEKSAEDPVEEQAEEQDRKSSEDAHSSSEDNITKSGSEERHSSEEIGDKRESLDRNAEESEMAVEAPDTQIPKPEPDTENMPNDASTSGTNGTTGTTGDGVPTAGNSLSEPPINGVHASSSMDVETPRPSDGAAGDQTNERSRTNNGDNDTYDEDMRFSIKLDITIGNHQLIDQFEWDINNPENDPEAFGLVLANDLALPLEFSTAISHAIREQVQAYTKALFNSGYQFDGKLPRDASLQNELAMPVNEHQFLRRPELLPLYTPALAEAKISGLDPSAHEQEVERREIRSRRRLGRSSRRGHDTRPGSNPNSNSDVVFLPQEVKGPDFCTPVFSSALPGGLDRNRSILYMTVYRNDENYGGDKQDLVYYFHKQRRERNILSTANDERSMSKLDKPRWIVKLKVPRGLSA